MNGRIREFEPYSQTFIVDLLMDEEEFVVLFRVVDEILDHQEIFDYEKEDVILTSKDTVRMEIERIFHNGKDETLEIAQTKPGFYDRILNFLIRYFIEKEKRWMRKTKKTKVVANYKSFKVSKTVPPHMDKTNESTNKTGSTLNQKF